MRRECLRARVALLVLTTIWGSTFVVLQSSLEYLSPLLLIAARFALAALTLVALRPGSAAPAFRAIRQAAPLSLAMLAGFALQTVGLGSTTPARSAFVTSLSVLLVPLLDLALGRRRPRPALAGAVLLAAGGIYVLFRPVGREWRPGDTWTALAALAFAFYIVELARMARRLDATTLVLAQSLTIAVVAGALAPFVETLRLVADPRTAAAVAYLGVVCTALTFVLMTWAQARVEPVEAAVIYTLEPVVAAAFSVALGREPLALKLVLGGGLIVAAVLASGLGGARAGPGRRRPPAPVAGPTPSEL